MRNQRCCSWPGGFTERTWWRGRRGRTLDSEKASVIATAPFDALLSRGNGSEWFALFNPLTANTQTQAGKELKGPLQTQVSDNEITTPHGGQDWRQCANYVDDFSVTTNGLGTPQSGLDPSPDVTYHQPSQAKRFAVPGSRIYTVGRSLPGANRPEMKILDV